MSRLTMTDPKQATGTQKKLLDRINQKLSEPEHIEKINSIIKNYKK